MWYLVLFTTTFERAIQPILNVKVAFFLLSSFTEKIDILCLFYIFYMTLGKYHIHRIENGITNNNEKRMIIPLIQFYFAEASNGLWVHSLELQVA